MSGARRGEWPYVELEAAEADADALGAALLDAGSNGIEQTVTSAGLARLRAWFDVPPDIDRVASIVSSCAGVDSAAARAAAESISTGATPDDDWLRLWKEGFEPVAIGSRLVVFPSWKRELLASYPDRLAIEIDPGMAFGTGTHETTRLCLEWLDANWCGSSVVDVGTGTGILAMAAALLEPESRVVAVDVDPVAIDVATQNATINHVQDRIDFHVGGPESVAGVFDVVLANLTADVILAVAGALVALARPGGLLVLSGILAEQADWLTTDLCALGLVMEERRASGEWIALVLRRP